MISGIGRGSAITSSPVGEPVPPSVIFINYYEKDGSSAQKLYLDLKAAALNPWIDKENLLPGQNRRNEADKVIRTSNYFVALLSTICVKQRGDARRQITIALDVLREILESSIYVIPARLDNIDIPFELSDIQHVDMFPTWEDGLRKLLKAMNVDDPEEAA